MLTQKTFFLIFLLFALILSQAQAYERKEMRSHIGIFHCATKLATDAFTQYSLDWNDIKFERKIHQFQINADEFFPRLIFTDQLSEETYNLTDKWSKNIYEKIVELNRSKQVDGKIIDLLRLFKPQDIFVMRLEFEASFKLKSNSDKLVTRTKKGHLYTWGKLSKNKTIDLSCNLHSLKVGDQFEILVR